MLHESPSLSHSSKYDSLQGIQGSSRFKLVHLQLHHIFDRQWPPYQIYLFKAIISVQKEWEKQLKSGGKFTGNHWVLSILTQGAPEWAISGGKEKTLSNTSPHLLLVTLIQQSSTDHCERQDIQQDGSSTATVNPASLPLIVEARIIVAPTRCKYIQKQQSNTCNRLYLIRKYLEGFKHSASGSTCSFF